MKKFIKITAAILVLTMLSGMTACTEEEGTPVSTGNTAPTQTSVTTADPDLELDNQTDWNELAQIDEIDSSNEQGTGKLYETGKTAGTVKALCYYDLAKSQPELAELLAQRFGGTIETEMCTSGSAYFEKLGVLIAADDSPDIIRYDWMAYPHGMSKNMFTPLDDWLDMDSALWKDEKEVIEGFNYAGKHYYYPSSVSTNFAIVYNKLVLDEIGLDDPMDLYFEGNWTWDTFERMISEWANQGEDYIGFTGGSWTSMMFVNTTGTKIIDMTGSEIINNMKNQNVQRTMDWLSEMKKKKYIGDGFIDPGTAFQDGKLLFLGMGYTWAFEGSQETLYKQKIDYDIGAVPFPRDPNADKYYLSADSFGFLVPTGAKNIQGAVDWILCGRMYETDPEIIAADVAERTDTKPAYFAKCPDCKYDYEENNNNDLTVCPECGAARKQKFKPVYSEEQIQIEHDMVNPDKFTFVFDNAVGFSDDFSSIFIGDENTVFDGPIYYGTSYTQLRDVNFGLVESYLDPYRDVLAQAVAE